MKRLALASAGLLAVTAATWDVAFAQFGPPMGGPPRPPMGGPPRPPMAGLPRPPMGGCHARRWAASQAAHRWVVAHPDYRAVVLRDQRV
jgi:hypothetical protein